MVFAYAAHFLELLSPMFFLYYATSALGLEEYGLIVVSYSIFSVCSIIVGLGFNVSMPNRLALLCNDRHRMSMAMSKIVTQRALVCLLFSVIYGCICFFIPFYESFRCVFLAVLLGLFGVAFSPFLVFQAIEKVAVFTFVSSVIKALLTGIGYFLISNESDIIEASIVIFAPYLVSSIVMWSYLNRKHELYITPISIRNSNSLGMKDLAVTLAGQFSSIVYITIVPIGIAMAFGSSYAAVYGVAEKLVMAARGMVGPITNVMVPVTAKKHNSGEEILRSNVFLTLYVCGPIFFIGSVLLLSLIHI